MALQIIHTGKPTTGIWSIVASPTSRNDCRLKQERAQDLCFLGHMRTTRICADFIKYYV